MRDLFEEEVELTEKMQTAQGVFVLLSPSRERVLCDILRVRVRRGRHRVCISAPIMLFLAAMILFLHVLTTKRGVWTDHLSSGAVSDQGVSFNVFKAVL